MRRPDRVLGTEKGVYLGLASGLSETIGADAVALLFLSRSVSLYFGICFSFLFNYAELYM